ncbi:MAG: c-type cytochrome [Wenzhouxiangella sp.]|nr:c-type cytochrome [Wenzhouxiangella sp.]
MSVQSDSAFIKQFSMVLAGLVVFAIVIMGVAWILHGQLETPYNPARTQAKLDRLAPVAGVYAGETGRAAALAAAKAAAPEAMAVAFDGSLDGAMIYDSVCATCHANGVAGAPEMVASAWSGRLDKGTEMLIDNAINGIGAMPARGGRADLSDEQVAASVTHMLDMLE